MKALATIALAIAAPVVGQARTSGSFELAGVAAQRLADTNGDGRQELLLIHKDQATGKASLLRIGFDDNNKQLTRLGQIQITDPTHTLIAVADLLPMPGDEIILATPKHTACVPWETEGARATAPARPIVLARRARFNVRVDEPKLSSFVIDLNKDGLLDLMLPSLTGVQPYFQEKVDENGLPIFRRMAPVKVPVSVSVGTGTGGLDQELTGGIGIPQIHTEDLNADGRPDLLTSEGETRSFHIQRTDGTFADPIHVDLKHFVDSTPMAIMDLGKTAVLGDRQLMRRGDLNGDGFADHVIAHRRKIWTFLGNSNGPQFKNARTQAVADDITELILLDLDGDKRDDLLTFRVQLPGLGTILLGLVQSIDIDVRAVGYPSEKGGFARTPKWRRTVTIRVPPLLSLLSRQDELIDRFTNLISKARVSARGEFLTKGQSDLALVREDSGTVDLFSNVPAAPQLNTEEGGRLLSNLLFEEENTVFDIDRVFGLASGFLDRMSDQAVGERKPTASIKLRDTEAWFLTDLRVGEFDGRPGEELLAVYHSATDSSLRAYDVIAWQ